MFFYRSMVLLPPPGGGWAGRATWAESAPIPSRSWVSPLLASPRWGEGNPSNDVARDLLGKKTSPWKPREGATLRPLLRRSAAIDDQLAPSHEGRLIRGQVQDTIGDLLGSAESAQGHAPDRGVHSG